MKKVSLFIGTLSTGGAERVVSNLSLNLNKNIKKKILTSPIIFFAIIALPSLSSYFYKINSQYSQSVPYAVFHIILAIARSRFAAFDLALLVRIGLNTGSPF